MAGLEALQQAILQRPGLVGYGVSAARDEGRERRLHELAQSGMLVEGILEALGLAVQQDRFNQQMEETQYQFDTTEGKDRNAPVPVAGVHRGMPVMGQPQQGYRAQAAAQAAERHGWDRAVEGSPEFQQAARQKAQLEALIMGDERGWRNQIRPLQYGAMQQDYELGGVQIDAARQGMQQDAEMHPYQIQGAQQNLRQGDQNYQRGAQEMDDAALQRDWLKRFREAKSNEERDAIIGENVELYFRRDQLEQELGARRDLAGAGKPGESGTDFVRKELRERSKAIEQKAMGGMDAFGRMMGESEVAVARRAYHAYQIAQQVADTPQFPRIASETDEAYLNRLLGAIARTLEGTEAGAAFGKVPDTGASQVPAQGNEDWTPARE